MSEPRTPLGVALIGVGGIAASHLAALRSTDEARLVGVTDLALGLAAQVADREGCAVYPDVDALLAAPEVEAVIVCTPNITHEELGHRVLDAGRHLLMEKPLAMTVEGAAGLEAHAERAGKVLAVGHSHRFSDQSLAVRSAIDSGGIGRPNYVRITMNGGWIWPGWDAWVLDPARSGGHSLHNGVHLTDLAAWWMGEPATSVYAAGQHATSAALQIHDYLVIQLGFASGASAICEVSRAERPRTGSFLELVVAGDAGLIERTWDADGLLAWTETGLTTWPVPGGSARTFVREIESFANAARGIGSVVPPTRDAVAAVEVAEASEASLRTGRTVLVGGAR
ncbi:Gfo/Idh/MocA family protein [Agromyces silvae]|uniref:Gfo/Idh/MocA family protein n=1 Tax=Agromyces silvae TaxID=3388266 RepID=UPI00280A5670|nr:Gfo/Idh/MocA family oxidoreductase [Agromyces protaetiae]